MRGEGGKGERRGWRFRRFESLHRSMRGSRFVVNRMDQYLGGSGLLCIESKNGDHQPERDDAQISMDGLGTKTPINGQLKPKEVRQVDMEAR